MDSRGFLRELKAYEQSHPDDDLAARHIRLAVWVAKRYRGRGAPFEDLLGEALAVLWEAARHYPTSPARKAGVPFVRYASRALHYRLRDFTRAFSTPLHIPQDQWERMNACKKAVVRLHQRFAAEGADRDPTPEEIAAETGLHPDEVRALRDLLRRKTHFARLESPIADDATVANVVPDGTDLEEEVIERLDSERQRAAVAQAVEKLPGLAKVAVSLKFGVPVESLRELRFEELLHAAASLSGAAKYGRRLLRRELEELAGEAAVGRPNRADAVAGGLSPLSPESPERALLVQHIWRSLRQGVGLPPALVAAHGEPAGAVRAGQ